MGRKRKNTNARKKKAKQDAYLQAIGIIIISMLLAILIYAQTGILGKVLSETLRWINGLG